MTENKRFNLVGSYLYDGERCVSHFNDPSHRDEIVDLLNSLSEENEQLKFQLQSTCYQRDEFHRGARENANRVGKMKKENEELEQRIKNKDCLIQQLRNALNTDYYKESQEYKRKFIRVCEELAEENELYRKLKKENEQLKQTIREAYETERTQIGQNVLRQLLESLE